MTAENSAIEPLRQFSRLSGIVHEAKTVDETVEAVADFALQCLGCSAAAILLGRKPSQLQLAVATDDTIGRLAASETTTGPHRDALRSETALIIDDLARETRWPDWKPAADHDLTLRSFIVLRLKVAGASAGLLFAGHPHPNAFGDDEEAIAHIVSRHASIAVAGARHQASLAEAVDARKLVGQAMGILMERYGLDSDQAFAVLRRHSQDTNTKLRTIALELITTRNLPGLPPFRTPKPVPNLTVTSGSEWTSATAVDSPSETESEGLRTASRPARQNGQPADY